MKRLVKLPARRRVSAVYHVTQPGFDHERMATFGDVSGTDVFVNDDYEVSAVLGPDGEPLIYEREPMGFDLRPKWSR